MSLILRGEKGSKLTTSELDNNLTYLEELALNGGSQLVELTYNELVTTQNSWIPGTIYHITNFKTCYDQPNYNYNQNVITTGNYRIGETHSLMVLALANDTLSIDAWQPDYPKDKIKYDWTWDQTEVSGGTAFGRIIERIDEFNNRTDFDHREVKFVRYPFWVWDKDNPFAGTISVVGGATAGGMTVSGIGTNFNGSHQPWSVISIPELSGTFFFITEIISATQMVIESNLTSEISGEYNGLKYYWTGFEGNRSYYQSVLGGLTSSFTASEHLMFAGSMVQKINNYFGDVANLVDFNEDTFLLPNNVLFSGSYRDNRFGNYCINNTFDDSCDGNEIGHEFGGNIITNDFDDNRIGNGFFGNVITGDFEDNEIGNFFEENYIINEDFNDNEIGDGFYNNRVWGKSDHNFNNNIIGNNFDSNEIYVDFSKNQIGYSFSDNEIYGDFEDNQIGNDFDNNSVGVFNNGNSFQDNQIGNNTKGNNFEGDVSGNIIINNFTDNNILGQISGNHISNYFIFNQIGNEFINNTIGLWFDNNEIGERFGFNKIGHYFNNNNIGDDFGYGTSEAYGNKIESYFQNNEIGKYFYSNTIIDLFSDNITGNYFAYNYIQVQNLNNVDFLVGYNNIISFTDNTGLSPSIPGTDGFYEGLTASSENGYGSTFDVNVSSSVVTSVTLNNDGFEYIVGDILTISHEQFGGTAGFDIEIIVGSVSATPPVYGDYNCTIFRNSNGLERLSYYDGDDVLTITEISNP